ncbi:protein BUNDLE SHEATH DEFECTIVE 2, chloroplastic isoform X3 [Rhododendron vialii]|uniref:protein BUNDLE SHEATH DEFECTIVE 2, chloroplastic isoform X3 n=1 Tax=Rhododendron vialii TaxID=182163 RepID=UPI0026604A13|nr:protein BUNDLE SHEATH DEFECTIVE 2, chloroplastic isoform X3 [Rhododendron vialii]
MGHSQEFPPPLKISSLPISLSLTGYLDSTFRLTMAGGRGGGVPQPLRVLASAAAVLIGGFFTLSLASTATIGAIQAVTEARRRKFALPCGVCNGIGFYICKLCKGNSTIEWSPTYDPQVINPCLCPTCDGVRAQRCLNCLGKGYYY